MSNNKEATVLVAIGGRCECPGCEIERYIWMAAGRQLFLKDVLPIKNNI